MQNFQLLLSPWFIRFFIWIPVLSGIGVFISSFQAEASPPPQTCSGQPPIGFEEAYPSFPLGHATWFLVLLALILPIYSHIQCQRQDAHLTTDSSKKRTRLNLIFTLLGALSALGTLLLFFSLMMMGLFRNDCHFCQLTRPPITWINEISLVSIFSLILGVLLYIIRKGIPNPFYKHILTLTLVPFGFILWLILLMSSNHTYLEMYCLP